MRTLTRAFTVGTMTLLFAIGCETAADQQRKANEAQADANEKTHRAQTDADRTAQKAQADADHDVSEAQAKFSQIRADFRHDVQSKLVEVDKEIDELRLESTAAAGKKKEKIEANLPIIEQRRTRVRDAFRDLEQASPNTWDQAKGEVEKLLAELEHTVESAT